MIKIKLQERRTISASEDLVDSLSNFYKSNYLKLVEIYLKYKNDKKIQDLKKAEKDPKTTKGSDIYKIALNKLKSEYGDLMRMRSPISPDDFKKQIQSNFQKKVIYEIASLPNNNIIPHIVKQDTALKAFKSAQIDFEEITGRIQDYLGGTRKKDIKIYLELSSEQKNYHGLTDFDAMSISVNYDVNLFKKVLFFERDIPEFFAEIDKQLTLTKRSVYHEIQHLFVAIVKDITGFSTYGSGPRSTSQGDLPDSDPEEVQTYAQNSVTLFNEMIDELELESKQIKPVKDILLKNILNSNLSSQERVLFKTLKQDVVKKYTNHIRNNLNNIKSFNEKFYNYALQILFSSVKGDDSSIDRLTIPISQRYKQNMQENNIMDKIKVILTESQISKEYTKEEIRKIIRDEFEKLLKDKETRKEMSKITKEFVKKFYRELSQNSTYVVDRIDV